MAGIHRLRLIDREEDLATARTQHNGHQHHHRDGHEHAGGFRGLLWDLFRPHSHDAADSVDTALEASAEGIRAVKISLVALLVTASAQAAVVIVTGSVALLADTIHNFSDALTAVPLWIAFVLGRRRANTTYTSEDLARIFIVLMIAASAVLAGYESIRRLIEPTALTYPWVVMAAGVIGFAGNELVATYRIRVGRRIGSAALVADGLHARTDGFTSLAVVLGAIGVLLGFPLADPLVGLVITVAILVVLRGAARDIYRRLMDAVDPALTEQATSTLRGTPGVRDVGYLRLQWIGHRLSAGAPREAVGAERRGRCRGPPAGRGEPRRRLAAPTIHVSPQASPGSDPRRRTEHHATLL